MEHWINHTPQRDADEYGRLLDRLQLLAVGGVASLTQLAGSMRRVLNNEVSTRHMLAREVYGVPDDLLDDVVRVRMTDLSS